MKGKNTNIDIIRRRIFKEVSKLAYEKKNLMEIDELPYKIVPYEVPTYRNNVFMERAVATERLRLALGFHVSSGSDYMPLSKSVSKMQKIDRPFTEELINVITMACSACPSKSHFVTDGCRGCLAHPCTDVCPTSAVSIIDGKSFIDSEKCIDCSKCKAVCPYQAIIKLSRPCARVCGVDAIESDYLGRAKIDFSKCVYCGMCIVECPFGAIADKSEIYQMISNMNNGEKMAAAIAPAVYGQLGLPLEKMKEVFKILGFCDVVEVALGADIGAIMEAHHFAENVPEKQDFLATSCCPAWSLMAKREFPDIAHNISESTTPMIETARVIKERNKNVKVCFIGPCIAKKSEATRLSVKSHVDYVITFEELYGMIEAKEIDLSTLKGENIITDASSLGRGYACASGVSYAILENIKSLYPQKTVLVDKADGLRNCRKMLQLARSGARNGYLLEGMACPSGCIGGPSAMISIKNGKSENEKYKNLSEYKLSLENPNAKK